MSGAKETPRQKMIGLMYLVLMAMLAMNVSKDVLDAFITVNGSLMQTQSKSEIQNDLLFNDIQSAYALDAKKTQIQMDKANEIRKHTAEMLEYIKKIKSEVIAKTEEITTNEADTIHLKYLSSKDNYDIPTNVMVGLVEDGSEGKSRKLHLEIEAFKSKIESFFSEKDLANLKLGLNLEGGIQDGQELNWEVKTFDRTPLVATITILSKLEMDILNAEYSALNMLYSSIGKDDFPFDTIAAKVVAPTNYVLLGEEYNAEVFLAAFSTTQKPKITLNENDLEVTNGVGNYILKTNKEGMYDYNGTIEVMKKNGEIKTYPFQSSYIVARPSLTVSPTKMNVVYIGIENPISISVPGVPNSKIIVKSSHGNIKKTGDGTYKLNPPKSGISRNLTISVSAKMANGTTKSMGTMQFRCKRIPDPKVRVMGKTSNLVFTRAEIKRMTRLKPVYDESFVFDGSAEMISCKMITFVDNKPIEVALKKGILNQKAKDILQRVKPGTMITITNIMIKGMDGSTKKIEPIVIKVR